MGPGDYHLPGIFVNLADSFVEELDQVPDGVPVVFSAHGVPKAVPAKAAERGLSDLDATFIPFSASTRMSGVDYDGRQYRKGAAGAVKPGENPTLYATLHRAFSGGRRNHRF